MSESNNWRPPGDEDDDEEEVDETVSRTTRRGLDEHMNVRLKTLTGLQDRQRCGSLRHRSQSIDAYDISSNRRKEGGYRQSYIRCIEMCLCSDATAYHLSSK